MGNCTERFYPSGMVMSVCCSRKAVADDGKKCRQHGADAYAKRRAKSRTRYQEEADQRAKRYAIDRARRDLVDQVKRLLHEADSEAFEAVQLNGFWKSTLGQLVEKAKR